jgi:O-antigen ligase
VLRRPFPDLGLARGLLFLLPLLLYLAPLAASWALPLVTLAVLWCAREEGVLAPGAALAEGWMWYPILAVLALSALWALDGRAAIILAVRLAGLILAGILLVGTIRRLAPAVLEELAAGLAWGMAVAGVLVAVDLLAGAPVIRLLHGPGGVPAGDAYSRGGVFQGIAAAPLALGLWRTGHRRLAIGQWAAAALAVLVGVQMAAKAALLAGLLGGGVVLALPLLRWLLPVAIVGVLLALPFALPLHPSADQSCWLAAHKPSGLHRLMIWNWVDDRIRERPWLGWGLDASRRMPGAGEHVHVERCPPGSGDIALDGEILPLHPHDAALQIWLELGALGAAAAGLAIAASIGIAFRGARGREAAAPAAMISAAAVVAALSFGIWQEWWIAVLCLTAGVAAAALGIHTEAAGQRPPTDG